MESLQQKNNDVISSDEISEILLNTREQGQMIDQLIRNQIEVKDNLINKLHNELDIYRKGAADRFEAQLLKAVIKVRKDMQRIINKKGWEELSADEVRKEYTYSFDDLSDLLEQQNVDPYRTGVGETFDPAIHQAKIEATSDMYLDKKIKESISEGYKMGSRVLIPERVCVYQYKK